MITPGPGLDTGLVRNEPLQRCLVFRGQVCECNIQRTNRTQTLVPPLPTSLFKVYALRPRMMISAPDGDRPLG